MMIIKPKGFYQNRFYVEFLNNKEYDNGFMCKSELAKLQKCKWIKILRIRELKPKNNDFFYKEVYNIHNEEMKL